MTDTITRTAERPFTEVLARLRGALESRGIAVFAAIDHAAGAREAGLSLPEETVLIFGNPKVGTAVMQADPRAGLDLPLRVLVRAVGAGAEVVYRDPRALGEVYDLADAAATLAALAGVLDQVTAEAVG
jgi:uncharacterized protein (DUF302 family)